MPLTDGMHDAHNIKDFIATTEQKNLQKLETTGCFINDPPHDSSEC